MSWITRLPSISWLFIASTLIMLSVALLPETIFAMEPFDGLYKYLISSSRIIRGYAAVSDFPRTTAYFIVALPFCFFISLAGYLARQISRWEEYRKNRDGLIRNKGVASVLGFDLSILTLLIFVFCATLFLFKDPSMVGRGGVNHSRLGMTLFLGLPWALIFPVFPTLLILDGTYFCLKFKDHFYGRNK